MEGHLDAHLLVIPSLLRSVAAALACCLGATAAPAQEPANLFYDGRILLNDGRGSAASALLSRGGRVLAVGSVAELLQNPEAKGARRVDLGGAVALPGLQDAHVDLEAMIENQDWLDLSSCASYAQLIERVRARAAKLPEGAWILGQGWDQNRWDEHQLPHHLLLSAQIDKHPVYLEHAAGELALVNSCALRLAHLDGQLDPPPRILGGRVLLDDSRHASGLLVQQARALVRTLFPPREPGKLRAGFLALQEKLLSQGLTCVHDHGTSSELLRTLQELRNSRQLLLRVVAYPEVSSESGSSPWPTQPLVDAPLDLLSVPGVHLCLDGPVAARAAALIEPYVDLPKERGALVMDEERLSLRLSQAVRLHLQPVIEAHGDRAARLALDTIERLYAGFGSARELRPRIEGVQVVAPKDWPRFPQLSVTPCLQPLRSLHDLGWLGDALGPERFTGAQAWRMLAPELKRLALGSGATELRGANPLRTFYATRVRPSAELLAGMPSWEPVDAGSALAAMTSGAAWSVFQEERRGRLMPGFQCDLSVISLDPLAARPDDLLKAKVKLVVINGEIVWRAK